MPLNCCHRNPTTDTGDPRLKFFNLLVLQRQIIKNPTPTLTLPLKGRGFYRFFPIHGGVFMGFSHFNGSFSNPSPFKGEVRRGMGYICRCRVRSGSRYLVNPSGILPESRVNQETINEAIMNLATMVFGTIFNLQDISFIRINLAKKIITATTTPKSIDLR